MRDRNPPRNRDDNPFRAYTPYATGVGPATRGAPIPNMSSSRQPQPQRRHAFTLFHDGNAGHFWRGEVGSLLGDAVLATGVLMWLAQLTSSPAAIALAVGLMAFPWVLAGPLAIPFHNVKEPGQALRRIGVLRVLLTLGFIPMHFNTIYPVVFALLFGISLLGRLREGLRVAATRTCLGPGMLEVVANDLQVGASVVAVLGPLLASLFFILLDERILLVSVGAAVIYLLGSNSDGFLDALPPARRAFLQATLESAVPDARMRREILDAARAGAPPRSEDDDDDEVAQALREQTLPEWYQQGPRTLLQGFQEIHIGLGLAGTARSSRISLLALGALALIGGGLATLEVFYIQYFLQLPTFYLGALLAAEAGGLVLGAFLATGMAGGTTWRFPVFLGLFGSGVALLLMIVVPSLLVALLACLALGASNALGVAGARTGLRAGFTGRERRAMTAAESWITALCGVVGVVVFVFLYQGPSALPPTMHLTLAYHGLTIGEMMLGAGGALLLASAIFAINLLMTNASGPAAAANKRSAGKKKIPPRAGSGRSAFDEDASGMFPAADEDWADGDSRYLPGYEHDDESRYMTGYGPADDSRYASAYQPAYDDEDDEDEYPRGRR